MDDYQKIFEELVDKKTKELKESLTEEEVELIIEGYTSDIINDLQGIADDIVHSLNESSDEQLEAVREIEDGFLKRNIERWNKGFNALQILIIVCSEAGGEVNNTHKDKAIQDNNLKFDLIVRLHARACHISSEILWLLKGGFADAAHARWRALHEIVVTATFLLDHSVDISMRYIDHEVIESYKAMKQLNQYETELGVKGFSEEEIKSCKTVRDEMIIKYGKEFIGNYGWAASVLNNKKPNFSDLEKAVDLDHLRPYYKWASQNIHANINGIKNKLGLAESHNKEALLAGPSNSGMTDPAQLTALSLSKISTELLRMYANIDSIVMQHVIIKLSDNIGELFWEVDGSNNSLI